MRGIGRWTVLLNLSSDLCPLPLFFHSDFAFLLLEGIPASSNRLERGQNQPGTATGLRRPSV